MNKISKLCLVALGLLGAYSASAAAPNDSFANRIQLSGSNVTYSGEFSDATLEPGEPWLYGTNTVWLSWTAPASGWAGVAMEPQVFGQAQAPNPAAIWTGSTFDELKSVNIQRVYGYQPDPVNFAAVAGVTYQFQLSGPQTNYVFSLGFQPYGPLTNDYFTNAIVLGDHPGIIAPAPILSATMEPGEPMHWGAIPQKSVWWKWTTTKWSPCTLDSSLSSVSNVTAVYVGNSVDTLALVAKGTNSTFAFNADGGETYYIASSVASNADGYVQFNLYNPDTTASHPPDGNVLYEPSWEGTYLNPVHWHIEGSLGGYVNEYGGVDGMTWPQLGGGTAIWQDFPTTPGHVYHIKFAYRYVPNNGEVNVAVLWNEVQIGISHLDLTNGGWNWENYFVTASNTTSRIRFHNLNGLVEMDAFSAVDVSDPPKIVTQPASVSSVVGGAATMAVGVTGTAPLHYQWYFQDTLMDGETASQLTLSSMSTNQIGDYRVVITNKFGMVTSAVASVLVDVPHGATILFEPYGDTVSAGGDYNFTVAATGTPPLRYQWSFNGTNIVGGTNQNLLLTNIQIEAAGTYVVRVQDSSSTVWSLPARLAVSTNDTGGGQINFANWYVDPVRTNALPVFDSDGTTLLSGSGYAAQLYAGPDLASLRPVGQPTPFQSGFDAGIFVPETLTLGNVASGSNVTVQVRAWDTSFGPSYEVARAMGGKFGKSAIFQVVAGGGELPTADLVGLKSFSLQAGLPYLQVATITLLQQIPPNTLVWTLHGQAGNLYTIERRDQGVVWQPYRVVTNATGTVNFTDKVQQGPGMVLYRARILD